MWSYYDIANPECQYAQLPLELDYTMDPSPIEDRNAETTNKPLKDDTMCKRISDDVNDDLSKTGDLRDLAVSVSMRGYVVRDILDLPKEESSKTEDNDIEEESKDNEEDDTLLDIKSVDNEIEDPSTMMYGYHHRVFRDTLL